MSESAPTLVAQPREAAPLQQEALGALRPRGQVDLVLLPRVVGGACVPEQRCTLLLWVGGEGALVTARHDAAVDVLAQTPAGHSAGFVEVVLTVHGPEASLVFEARRGAELVAERTLRLPVALGETSIASPGSLFASGEEVPLSLVLPPGREQGFLDVFAAGRWRVTQGFPAEAQRARLVLRPELLAHGLVRLQAHTDRFSGEGAGARVVYVREVGESPVTAVGRIALGVRAAGFSPVPWDAGRASLPAHAEPALAATFLLSALDGLRVPLPRAVSARPLELQRLSRAQNFLRFAVSALLLVCAVGVGLSLMRSGLGAQSEADAILARASAELSGSRSEAEDDAAVRGPQPRSRGVYFVVCLVLAVGLAFVLAALLIVAKPLWF